MFYCSFILQTFSQKFLRKNSTIKNQNVCGGGARLIWTLNKIISGFEFTGSGAPLLGVKAINKWTKLGCHIDLTNEQTREESATSTQLLTRWQLSWVTQLLWKSSGNCLFGESLDEVDTESFIALEERHSILCLLGDLKEGSHKQQNWIIFFN